MPPRLRGGDRGLENLGSCCRAANCRRRSQPPSCRRALGSPRASSIARLTAAAMFSSMTSQRWMASRQSRRRTAGSGRPRSCQRLSPIRKTRCAPRSMRRTRQRRSTPASPAFTSRGRSYRRKSPAFTIRRSSVPPTPRDLELLTAPRRGVTLVTLAPERVPAGLHRRARKGGVARFAGSLDGRLQANEGGAGRRAHRLHPSFQRDASAIEPRSGANRSGA